LLLTTTRDRLPGLQEHIDYLSLQALLYKRTSMSLSRQVLTILAHSKRLAEAS
jgi:hypothetical protein